MAPQVRRDPMTGQWVVVDDEAAPTGTPYNTSSPPLGPRGLPEAGGESPPPRQPSPDVYSSPYAPQPERDPYEVAAQELIDSTSDPMLRFRLREALNAYRAAQEWNKETTATPYSPDRGAAATALARARSDLNAISDDIRTATANAAKAGQIPTSIFTGAGSTDRFILLPDPTQPDGYRPVPNPNYREPRDTTGSGASYLTAAETARHNQWVEGTQFPSQQQQALDIIRMQQEEAARQRQWQEANSLADRQAALERQQAGDVAAGERNRLSTTGSAYGSMMASWPKAVSMMALPGQQYQLGFEPGGIMQNIASLSGRAYNPETYRAPIVQYDPAEQWKRAAAMIGGQ